MAAVDTPYELRLSWNPTGHWPSVATGVHGTYHVTGLGPVFDVYYRQNGEHPDHSEKLATGVSSADAYDLCVDHNKATLEVIAPECKRVVARNERQCSECGIVHAGACF